MPVLAAQFGRNENQVSMEECKEMNITAIQTLINSGNLLQAKMICEEMLKHQPEQPEVTYLLGLIYLAERKFDKAFELFELARKMASIDQRRSFAPGYINLGISLDNRGNFEIAIVCFRTAIELDQHLSKVLSSFLARTEHAMGLYDDAVIHYKHAINSDPLNNLNYYNLLTIFQDMSLFEKTDSIFNEMRKIAGLSPSQGPYVLYKSPFSFKPERDAMAILMHPPSWDTYGTMRLSARQIAYSAARMGLCVVELKYNYKYNMEILTNKNIKAVFSCNHVPAQLLKSQIKFIQFLGMPPFKPVFRGYAADKFLSINRHIFISDQDSTKLASIVCKHKLPVSIMRTSYFEDYLSEHRSHIPINRRNIPILFSCSYEDPDFYRKRWKDDKDYGSLCDEIVEAAKQDFKTPLWYIADKTASKQGMDFDLTSDRILNLLVWMEQYLTLWSKKLLIEKLAVFPCFFILNKKLDINLKINKKSKVLINQPFPVLLDLLHDAKCTVCHLPSYMTGAITERIPNAMIRGSLVIAAENNAVRNFCKPGTDILTYGPDFSELLDHIENVLTGREDYQDIVEAGRETALREFNSDKVVLDVLRTACPEINVNSHRPDDLVIT